MKKAIKTFVGRLREAWAIIRGRQGVHIFLTRIQANKRFSAQQVFSLAHVSLESTTT